MDHPAAMDEDSAALVLQLQLQDAQELSTSSIQPPDAQLALALYRDELQRTSTILDDRKITRSIARACKTDGILVSQTATQERVAACDRVVACRLGGVRQPLLIEAAPAPVVDLDNEALQRLSLFNTVTSTGVRLIEYVRNGLSLGKSSTNPTNSRRCIACRETAADGELFSAPCTHDYCKECLGDLFHASFTDESLFPPRCCRQNITTVAKGVGAFLSDELIGTYLKKKAEFESKDRTYCSNKACAVFIPVQGGSGEKATCLECKTVTCTRCKAASHDGDCPEDPAHKQLLKLARANQWQQCKECKRMVELEIGCNHITCHCGHEFCYLCGLKWKTCNCRTWDEHRLLARAAQVAARQAPAAGGPAPARRVAALAAGLRRRHDCEVHNWRYARREGRCEQCTHTMPDFIFACSVCHIELCRRCKLNRV